MCPPDELDSHQEAPRCHRGSYSGVPFPSAGDTHTTLFRSQRTHERWNHYPSRTGHCTVPYFNPYRANH